MSDFMIKKPKLTSNDPQKNVADIDTWIHDTADKLNFVLQQLGYVGDDPQPSALNAYQLAVRGGFKGSETEFAAKLAAEYLPLGGTAVRTSAIPYGEVNSDSALLFTASVPGVTKLTHGTACMIRNNDNQTSASGWTLNVNGLGARPVYSNMAVASRETTLFNKAYTMLFVYDEDRITGGCWVCYRGYDSNTNTIGYQIRHNGGTQEVTDQTGRYRLLFSSADMESLVPANTSSSTSATSTKTPNTRAINPLGPIYYYGATSILQAAAKPGAAYLWQQYTITLGYSFYPATLTTNKPVYLMCTPAADGSAVINGSTPITQALPTTNDGYIYIFLGVATSSTAMELCLEHPVVYHNGTGIRKWTGG